MAGLQNCRAGTNNFTTVDMYLIPELQVARGASKGMTEIPQQHGCAICGISRYNAPMKLIGSLTSPYVRKTRIVLAEKHVGYDFELESPWSADTHVPDCNPLGKVPVLIMDDGTSLFDSRVIVDYLDSMSPVSRLIPEAGRRRIMVKRWEALADGICDAAAAIFLERKRDASQQNAGWIDRQQKKIRRGLEAAAHELGNKKWCDGNTYTLADIALGCALGYLVFRFSEIEWRDAFPNLVELSNRLEKRVPFMETAPRDT